MNNHFFRVGTSQAGGSKDHDNHSPSHCVIRARHDLILGVDSRSGRVHLCCEWRCASPLRLDPDRAHLEVICSWTSHHVGSSDGRGPRSRDESTIVVASSIEWRRLTYVCISSLSFGSKGISWLTIILEAKALSVGVR
jgi:hypothetical protein